MQRPDSPWSEKYAAKTVILNGEAIEMIDVSPDVMTDDVPVFLAPGWNPDAQVLRQVMPEIINAGRRGVTFIAPHGIKESSGDAVMRKSQAALAALKTIAAEKVDAIGHSEAGLYLIDAALKEPEKFRSIVLVNPIGVLGEDSLPGLGKRFLSSIVQQAYNRTRDLFGEGKHTEHSRLMRHLVRGGKSSTSPRALPEVLAMASRETPEKLRQLRELGIPVGIIRTTEDIALPAERSGLREGDYDALEYRKGTHDEPLLEPEQMIPAALQLSQRIRTK